MSEKRYANAGLRKALITMACVLACGLANAADSLDSLPPDVQVDVLMKRITVSIKSRDYKSALPAFRKLISYNRPLPEIFDFYYIESLANSNTEETDKEAGEQIKKYFLRWGKGGENYQKVVEYSADVLPKVDAARVVAEAKSAEARKTYDNALANYERNVQNCPSLFRERVEEARSNYRKADQACIRRADLGGGNFCDYHEAQNDNYATVGATIARIRARNRLEEINATSSYEWCDGRYTKPTLPEILR